MNPNPHLERILYLSVPTDLQKAIDNFTIDPAILLPVEAPADTASFDPASLSQEMIISAMLRILAWDPGHKDGQYYRDFIQAVRPSISTELSQAAIAKAESKDYALAEEIFRAILGLHPEQCRNVLNLALVLDQRAANYRTLGNEELASQSEEEACLWYSRALSLDTVVDEAYLYAGHFFLKVNNTGRAIELFRHFVSQSPQHEQSPKIRKIVEDLEQNNLTDTLFKEAFDCIRMGKDEEGLKRIETFLERNPEVWNAWFIKGWAQRRLGRFADGIQSFRTTIELGGGNADTLNELAICLMESGALAESRKALEQALRQDGENTKIISNLGIVSLKAGNPEEARQFFLTVLEFDPEDQIARQYLDYLDK